MRFLSFILLFFSLSANTQITVKQNGNPVVLKASGISVSVGTGLISNMYSLLTDANTSAGVFKQDGTLVKTLWGNEARLAGVYSTQNVWDGKDDSGNVQPNGDYQFKLIASNIQDSSNVIGNTSDFKTGGTVHHAQDAVTSMCFTGSYGYYTVGYNEEHDYEGDFKFNINTPQQKINTSPGQGLFNLFICSDATRVYRAGNALQLAPDGTTELLLQFTYATLAGNDNQVAFSGGVPVGPAQTTALRFSQRNYTAIDTTYSNTYFPNSVIRDCTIGGMAVQQSGNYLFVSYFDRNQIHVTNKLTGVLVRTITGITIGSGMCIDANNDNALWVATASNAVSKYTINPDGTLSSAALTLSGLVKPLSLTCKSGTIAVMDGGNRQQVRLFNNATGAEGTPVGQLGGYAASSVVANDKFMFRNTKELFRNDRNNFIAFGLDGSLWVGDRGNMRVQHFGSTYTYIESIMNLGYFYSARVEKNDPTKVYANYLQFSVNYNNYSWSLTNNWAFPITEAYDDQFERLRAVTTLGNGRTYALSPHSYPSGGQTYHRWQIVELVAGGNLRFTGIEPSFSGGQFDVNYTMNSDGSLFRLSNTATGSPASWIRKPLTGFDGSNNPVWGADQVLASIPAVMERDPITAGGIQPDQITDDSIITTFNNELSDGYHLGGAKLGATNWSYFTSPSTSLGPVDHIGTNGRPVYYLYYQGPFPANGDFDIANNVVYPGSAAMAAGKYIAWGYHGEAYKGGQADLLNVFSSTGLSVTQFGSPENRITPLGEAPYGFGSNVIATNFRKLNSNTYLYIRNDEGKHGAVVATKLSGFDSVKTYTLSISKSGPITSPSLPSTDLMAGLEGQAVLTTSTAGWVMNPSPYNITPVNRWNMTTGLTTYKPGEKSLRLSAYPVTNNQTYTCTKTITSTSSTAWSITGQIGWPEPGEPDYNYFDILDNNGRVIVRLTAPYQLSNNTDYIKANAITIVSTLTNNYMAYDKSQITKFNITKINGALRVTYGNYPPVITEVLDGQADITRPTSVRVTFYNDLQRGHALDIANLKYFPQ